MEIEEIKDVLSRTLIFSGLDDVQRTLLAHICHLKQYDAGVEIIKEGQPGGCLYLIVQGKVSVFLPAVSQLRDGERLSEVKLNTLVAGNCFGEYSLLDGHYVSATVETLENTSILVIDKHDFQQIMDNDLFIAKTVYYNLARLYIGRLRKNDEELDQFFIY